MIYTAAMSSAWNKQSECGECLGPKQAQLITMHNKGFRTSNTKVVQLKSWLSIEQLRRGDVSWTGIEPETNPRPQEVSKGWEVCCKIFFFTSKFIIPIDFESFDISFKDLKFLYLILS